MVTPVAVCIPSIGKSGEMLPRIVDTALEDPYVEIVEVWDNHDMCPPVINAEMVRRPGLSIYEEWNAFAARYGRTHDLAFLNDDIVLRPNTLRLLQEGLGEGYALVSVTDSRVGYPRVRPVSGTFRRGGISGWAFMVRRGYWPKAGIDPRFKVWYGDDDLVWKIEQAGHRVGVQDGARVQHNTSTTVNSLDWVPAAQAADAELWKDSGRP